MISKSKVKVIALLSAVLLMLSVPFSAYAADAYERESNNTAATATVTYDDYNNYGKITSLSDVDYWKITFSKNGLANFWLGVPAGCNFELELFADDGSSLMAYSRNTTGNDELIRAKVYAGCVYYVRISSKSGTSSSYYHFRAKRYDCGNADVYTLTKSDGYDTRPTAAAIGGYIRDMGYTYSSKVNAYASTAYSRLPNLDIFVAHDHGGPGIMEFYDSDLYAQYPFTPPGNSRMLGAYGFESLNGLDLMVFCGCKTGVTGSTYGNLVDTALNVGVFCCIGWKEDNRTTDATMWLDQFFYSLNCGLNVKEAVNITNAWAKDHAKEQTIMEQYSGNRDLGSLVLG